MPVVYVTVLMKAEMKTGDNSSVNSSGTDIFETKVICMKRIQKGQFAYKILVICLAALLWMSHALHTELSVGTSCLVMGEQL
jgi:hypothetical protein